MTEVECAVAGRIELLFEQRATYLYVRALGDADEHDVLEACRRIAAECRRRGSDRLLVETELKRQMPLMGYYNVAQQLPTLGFAQIRFAFLDRRNLDFQRVRFGEDVAVNRGMPARAFNDLAAAERWLAEDSPAAPTETEPRGRRPG